MRPLVFCGPSGVGKSTLIQRLMDKFPDRFTFAVSHTTRAPRPGEIDGHHYHFVNTNVMMKAIENEEFFEHTTFCGNLYGTSFRSIRQQQHREKIVILDLTLDGVEHVKKNSGLNPWVIYVAPPNMEELRRRLMQRQTTENEDALKERLTTATAEISSDYCDFILVNDDLDTTFNELSFFIQKIIFPNV
nr:hypothetical protein [Microctonus hyperodae filamentous virus]